MRAVLGLVVLAAVAISSEAVTGAQRGAVAPTGTVKDPLAVVQQNGAKVSLPAQKAVFRAERGALRAKSKLAVPAQSVTVISDLLSIEAPFGTRDLPGGTLLIVKLEKDKDGLAFQGDATGNPEKGVVVVRTTDLKLVEKDGTSTWTLDAVRKLMPGPYAIVMADNLYMWPFEIR